MLTVNSLIEGYAPQELDDKVFWYAEKIILEDGALKILINDQSIAYSGELSEHAVIKNNPCAKSISSLRAINFGDTLDEGLGPCLVSAGSILVINDYLVLRQRTNDSLHDPGLWTSPAGRCDRTTFVTAMKETVEEFEILGVDSKEYVPEGAAIYMRDASGAVEYSYHSELSILPSRMNILLYLGSSFEDSTLLESSSMCVYYDRNSNTLECRVPIIARIPHKLVIRSKEFHTPTTLLTIKEYQCRGRSYDPFLSHLIGS